MVLSEQARVEVYTRLRNRHLLQPCSTTRGIVAQEEGEENKKVIYRVSKFSIKGKCMHTFLTDKYSIDHKLTQNIEEKPIFPV